MVDGRAMVVGEGGGNGDGSLSGPARWSMVDGRWRWSMVDGDGDGPCKGKGKGKGKGKDKGKGKGKGKKDWGQQQQQQQQQQHLQLQQQRPTPIPPTTQEFIFLPSSSSTYDPWDEGNIQAAIGLQKSRFHRPQVAAMSAAGYARDAGQPTTPKAQPAFFCEHCDCGMSPSVMKPKQGVPESMCPVCGRAMVVKPYFSDGQ